MKYLFYAILTIVVLLSFAAGGAKVIAMPQEIEFFETAGIAAQWLLPLGILQIMGGLFALYHRTRRSGLALIALGFLLSTFVIFMTGDVFFGSFSLLPVALCALVFRQTQLSGTA